MFIDWLVAQCDFPQYYVTVALIGIISIIPSVIILAYFHGTTGKDEWTNVEKYGIPFNILIMAVALFSGYKYNFLDEKPVDNISNNVIVHISSSNEYFERTKKTKYWDEFISSFSDYELVNIERIIEITDFVYSNLQTKLMNYDVNIYFGKRNKGGISVGRDSPL